ncbi:MAG: 50S ribosomal protein L25 [Gemmataceae bacterium]
MAETMKIVAKKRDKVGTNASRGLRKNGRLPVVVYGHKEESVSLSIALDDFQKVMRHHIRYIDLETEGGVDQTMIREVQWDYLGIDILHVDLVRVAKGERIQAEVTIEATGMALGVQRGGVLEQPHHTVGVDAPAMEIPEVIKVNVEQLDLGQAIQVKDLTFPDGVRPLLDPEEVVLHITSGTQAPVEGEEAAVPSQPEVIGKPKEESAE